MVGCRFALPAFDSAASIQQEAGLKGSTKKSILSREQMDALRQWFSGRQTGWEKSYADVAWRKVVLFSRNGKSVAYMNLSGDTLYAASYARKLTGEEIEALERILESQPAAASR